MQRNAASRQSHGGGGGGGTLNACKVVCIIIIAKVMLTLAVPDFFLLAHFIAQNQ